MQRNDRLEDWLKQILDQHPEQIILGLDRIRSVFLNLGLKQPKCPLIIVGGTNGKGSTVASLERIYREAGYRTGSFSSPTLFRHNELLRLDGQEVEDADFCEAYTKIEAAREGTLLTWFEFHTLAAFEIFSQQPLDVWILEVGLGGRLDAVNIMEADVAVVTSIGLDHMDRLGNTREEIGREKAGIFRKSRPVVCGDLDPPACLREEAAVLKAPFYQQRVDFDFSNQEKTWSFKSKDSSYLSLPYSQLACQNISTALMTIELLKERLPVSLEAIVEGIKKISLPGRIEMVPGSPQQIFDVAHNPAAVAFLREGIKNYPCAGKRRAVFSMLGDKDIVGSIQEIKAEIDEWYVAPLTVARAASQEKLAEAFQRAGITQVNFYSTIEESYQSARENSKQNDQLFIFGSFHTVAKVKRVGSQH